MFETENINKKQYMCLCGKSYFSYPALYTHIKQKHDGKPPGLISKPFIKTSNRGRPRLAQTSAFKENSKIFEEKKEINEEEVEEAIIETVELLQKLKKINIFTDRIFEIKSFALMNDFLENKKEKNNEKCIGEVLKKYLELISSRITKFEFESLYTASMFLLQFLIEKHNLTTIIRTGTSELLCRSINEFLNSPIPEIAVNLKIEQLDILKIENLELIMKSFFKWLSAMRYIPYKVFKQ